MSGVEILNQFTQASPLVGLALVISLMVALAFSLAVILEIVCDASLTTHIICGVLAIMGFIGILIFGVAMDCPENLNPQFQETFYQVTVSDDVSMQEFFSKYEVVEQEGRIFTVKEK